MYLIFIYLFTLVDLPIIIIDFSFYGITHTSGPVQQPS